MLTQPHSNETKISDRSILVEAYTETFPGFNDPSHHKRGQRQSQVA